METGDTSLLVLITFISAVALDLGVVRWLRQRKARPAAAPEQEASASPTPILPSNRILNAGRAWLLSLRAWLLRQRRSLLSAVSWPPPALPMLLTILLTGGAGLLLGGLWLAQQNWPGSQPWTAWACQIAGLLAFALGVAAQRGGRASSRLGRFEAWSLRACRLHAWQWLALGLALLLSWLAGQAAGIGPLMNAAPVAIFCWLASILLAITVAWQGRLRIPPPAWMAALFFAIAFALRGLATGRIPIVLSGDEASMGLDAVNFIQGKTNNIFSLGWFSFPNLYYFILSLSVRLLGQTTPALRIPAALVGGLTVAAVYLAARSLFDRRTAAFAAIFLTTFHFHNHFSRIGLNNIWDGLWYTVTLACLWLGWRREQRLWFVLCGLSLGFAQYFYVSGRALFPITLGWLLLAGLQDGPRFKRLLPDMAIMGVMVLVVLLPLANCYLRNPQELLAPMDRVSIFGPWLAEEVQITKWPAWRVVLEQVKKSLGAYTHVALRFWYEPGSPLLRPASATLFLLGLLLLLRRLRDDRLWLLALWLGSFLVVGALSTTTPAAQRFVGVAPLLAIIIGYALSELCGLLQSLWPNLQKPLSALALLSILLIGVDELRFYYLTYTPASRFGDENGLVAQRLASYLKDQPASLRVLLWGAPRMGYYSISSLPYLAPQITGGDVQVGLSDEEMSALRGQPLALVFLPEQEASRQQAVRLLPGGNLIKEYNQDGQILYWLYDIRSLPQITPLPDHVSPSAAAHPATAPAGTSPP